MHAELSSGGLDALELLERAECGADQLELLLVLLESGGQGAQLSIGVAVFSLQPDALPALFRARSRN